MSSLSDFLVKPLAGVTKSDTNTLQLAAALAEIRAIATDTTGSGADAGVLRLRNVRQANGAGPNVYLEGTNDASAVKTLARMQAAWISVTAGAERTKLQLTVLNAGANVAVALRGDAAPNFAPTAAGGVGLGTQALPFLEAWVGDTGGTRYVKLTATGPGTDNAIITESSALLVYHGAVATYSLGATALTMKGAGSFQHTIYAGADLANTNYWRVTAGTTGVTLNTSKAGTGTTQDVTVQVDGTRVLQVVAAQGDVVVGKTGLVVGATSGHLYIPAVAGVMTGVPTARAGFVPIVYDTTNDKVTVYNGSWKQSAALA